MTQNKSKLTIEQFEAIEIELRQIQAKLDGLWDIAFTGEAFRLAQDLMSLSSDCGGLAYATHPQTEWIGGDSSDPKNFVKRFPHIAGWEMV